MTVDKDLFLHDIAITAILYNEGHYLKEWLDYHLLAGVNHFYLYNNGSTDNYDEIIKPYVDKGLVTSTYYPGDALQFSAYNDAIMRYRFSCKYMAFVDGDEFIFPQNNKTIGEVVDDVLGNIPNAGGLAINWQFYGSNYQDKADYTHGVLERFTRRAPKDNAPISPNGQPGGNAVVKNIVNPRCVKYFGCPHNISYFLGRNGINSEGKPVYRMYNVPVLHDKIVVNHYFIKSKEEYILRKVKARDAVFVVKSYDPNGVDKAIRGSNEEFDDSILKYRDFRKKALMVDVDENVGGGYLVENLAKHNVIDYQKIFVALINNLAPTFYKNTPKNFLDNKIETFLTCRELSSQLKINILDDTVGNALEEASLNAIYKALQTNVKINDMLLLFSELPNILSLPYGIVENIRLLCIDIMPQILNFLRLNRLWREVAELEYLQRLLKEM